jgi:hypothetical protein
VRQGHPGPSVPAYRSLAQKTADARAHREDEALPWPVLVDDVEGRVHRAYGMLADPTFVVDVEGRIAFYNAITHAPTLHRAVEALVAAGGRGVVAGGVDRRPHLLHVIAGGWPALRRGLPQSALDLETIVPGSAFLPWLGHALRPVLAPIALRSEPLPARTRVALAAGAFALAVAGMAAASGARHAAMLRRAGPARG